MSLIIPVVATAYLFLFGSVGVGAHAQQVAAPANVTCTNVTYGYLGLETTSYLLRRVNPIGLSPVARDKSNDTYIAATKAVPFTFESCNSTYMGFPQNETYGTSFGERVITVYGRFKQGEKCMTAESDGALALKNCTVADGKPWLKQIFSSILTEAGNATSRGSPTQLVGYRHNETHFPYYTVYMKKDGVSVLSQTRIQPPYKERVRPAMYKYRILFFPPNAQGGKSVQLH
ncbi:hypothetical protein EXIGLDRAFT_774039 [Exidia glandulosa HHB12029]|uniref:Ricin B lectin domain-containing protein n=1 Tax=Exidia glandulosa HHB12029 TaxID=1314781 RepID=A0A165DBH2_EXIGL|nr:hypothetical protein EXIGLDRAFT_776814 [Exidia glandulosa HHB12029]KZV87058.1 hypothetical protein EXIGLDRAFT_774039 [Exidia glandulosa HHB12029]